MTREGPGALHPGVPDGPYAAIVANPYSGASRHRGKVAALVDALHRRGLEAVVVWDKDGLRRLLDAGRPLGRCRCLVAAGGDGTLRRLVDHEIGGTPVAQFPLGNENLFARQFGYTAEPEAFADAVVEGRTRAIDVGRVNGHRFTIVTSGGFDGAVAHRLHDLRARGETAKRAGPWSYLRPLADTAWGYGWPTMEVEIEGERTLRGALVMAFNLPQYGLGLKRLSREADATDGLLDYLVFERPGRWALLHYAVAAVLGGRHVRLRDVHAGRAAHLRIEAAEPVPMQVDGEALGHLPAEVALEPAGLNVLVA